MLSDQGKLYIWGEIEPDNFKNTPVEVESPDGSPFTAIDCGMLYTAVLNANGILYAWMNNDYGQCGVDPGEKTEIKKPLKVSSDIKMFSCGLSHLMMVNTMDTVFGLGCNDDGNCGFALDNINKGKPWIPTQSEYDYGKVKDI